MQGEVIKLSFSMGIFIHDESIKTWFCFLDKEHIFPFRIPLTYFIYIKKSLKKHSITPSRSHDMVTIKFLLIVKYHHGWLCHKTTHKLAQASHTHFQITFPQSSRPRRVPCLAAVQPPPKAGPAVGQLPAGDTLRPRVTPRSARGGGGESADIRR